MRGRLDLQSHGPGIIILTTQKKPERPGPIRPGSIRSTTVFNKTGGSGLFGVRIQAVMEATLPPPYIFPDTCSRCNTGKTETSFGLWYDYFTTSTIGSSLTTWRTADIPICNRCKDEVYNPRTRKARLIYGGMALGGLLLFLSGAVPGLVTGQPPTDNILILMRMVGLVMFLVGLILGVFLLIFPSVSKHRFMAWAMRPVARLNHNTGVIEFGNADYAARVRELNPERRFD